ncbi:hypothetical protein EYF80_002799 [Liparis tanakae]|uniref:Uncharacterized protein n=1 Tax=Liparis tanakae TaxID=230148 RepID=A0A4Z2JB34_9TELE|nr:hypothetical protein EYF80_002799 [Liparis tanakae]
MCSGRRKGVDSQFIGMSLLSGMSLALNGTFTFSTSAIFVFIIGQDEINHTHSIAEEDGVFTVLLFVNL